MDLQQSQSLAQAVEALPLEVGRRLRPMLADGFRGRFSPAQAEGLKEAAGLDDDAARLALLPLAAAYAAAPVSGLSVGAIAGGSGGGWYFGANLEFAGVGLHHSVHAEQAAIANAWLAGETGIGNIAVNYAPCGHCRQFMTELTTARTLNVTLPEGTFSLSALLPEAFGPEDLGGADRLLGEPTSRLRVDGLEPERRDPLVSAAFDAACRSYAPYSRCFAGVGIELKNGRIYVGRYAENAAFNPSLSPMHMALSQAALANEILGGVRRAVLVESRDGAISLRHESLLALKSVSQGELDVVVI